MVMTYIQICPLFSNIAPGTQKLWSMGSRNEHQLAVFWISVCLETQLLVIWTQHSVKIICIIWYLLMACKLFNGPFQWILLRYVADITSSSSKVRVLNIIRNWNIHVNIICNTFLFVVGFNFNQKSDLSFWRIFHNNINWEQRFNSDIQSIAHQLKLSIRRDKSDKSFVLKLTQSDTLMEFDIAEFNSFILWSSALSLVISFIVET